MNNNFKLMTKSSFLIFIIIFLLHSNLFAQPLTGVKSIPGDYATIEAAIAALNLQGVGAGGVTFNINAGHTETFTSSNAGTITATGTSSNQIVFQKSGAGNNPLITAGLGTLASSTTMTAYPGDAIISIEGGDYITFDGIDLLDNPAATGDQKTEVGYFLKKASSDDACKNVTIKNCNITLDKITIYSWGIYISNFSGTTSVTVTSTGGRHENIKIFNNNISNVYSGIFLRGFSAASPYDFYDQNIEIGVDGANSITDYGGGSSAAYGLRAEYHNNLKIANNTFNGGGASQTTTLYGISTGSGFNSNIDIYGNTISLSSGASSSIMYALSNTIGSNGVNNTVNINNNIIENCSQPGATGNSTWLIYNLAAGNNVNIYNNIIRNNSRANGTVYCINNSGGTSGQIYGNQIYNNSSGGLIHGIFIDDGTTISIYKNSIYNISSFSSLTSLAAAGITIAGTTSVPVNVYVYNNFISDLRATASSSPDAIRGINITGTTANSVRGLYYNTIFLNTLSVGSNFGTSGIYHTLSSTATSSVLDMRNNIVINKSQPNGTGKTVAFRRSLSTNLNNYSTSSNNNSFYAGTPGINNVIFFDGTNFDQTISEFKTRVAPRETSSFTEDVPFVNGTTAPFDLHVNTGIATQTESGGIPVTSPVGITLDFDGDSRNAVSPDVGADEFNGIGIDITAPFIGYTPLTHTTSVANRNLNDVTITDGSGVNTSPGTKPRIYFKRYSDNNTFLDNTSSTNGWKYTESSSSASPFVFLINYSLLFGGGAQIGDTIQYFVVAQDLASPPNVGISEGTFASQPSSVNLTGAAFPITGSINFYRIQFVLSGTVTVGTGGNYPSLTGDYGLFVTVNENFVGGNLTAQIISNINEPGIHSLNQWAEVGDGNYTLTIQPNAAVLRTISGSSPGGLIKINGADKVTIDGRFSGSGKYLAIQNANTASNTAAIHIISQGGGTGTSDITIRNSIIKAGSNSSSNIFGIFIGGTTMTTGSAGGADNDNISIIENNISNCRAGIFARGTTSDQMQNLIISGNIIGSENPAEYVTEYGTYIGYADAPQVTNNEVFNMHFDVSKWGIYFTSNVNNAVVSKNKVHSISQPGTTGYNSVGIVFFSSTGCFNNRIDNNMIYNLHTYGNTSMYLVGIRIAGGSDYKVYYNSVSITGDFGNLNPGVVSSCLFISSATTNADIRNNIFYNVRTGNDPLNYTIYSPNTTTFLNINNNNYYSTGNVIGYFGADIPTFNDWKTATGQDGNSVNVDPLFTGITDLHINSGVTPIVLESGGAVISGLTFDFDGDVRPGPAGSVNGGATAPDIGADEFDGVPSGASTFQLTVTVNNGWNMVSIPGLHPSNQNVNTWWPGKDPSANVFKYSGGYQSITSAVPSEGYWMKNLGPQTYNTGDEWPAGGILFVSHDPINGNAGWNLIGGYEYNAQTSGITTTPPGLVEGSVFGYSGGYNAASEMLPGYGYWIKLSAPGTIHLPPPSFKAVERTIRLVNESWGKIIITDNAGRSYTLYSVEDETNLNIYELPPLPPAGMFDVRFNSGRYAENLNSDLKQIEMNGMIYPVSIRTMGVDLRLQDETGRIINTRLKAGEEVTITQNINKLFVSKVVIPKNYSLEQNYPNPFNPTTIIEFAIPEDAKNVTLTIYNALGEKVTELVKGTFEPGYYKYQWDASNYANGLYLYELKTEKFVSVKKMLMLK